jgi:phosphoglycerate dehydrogenase-like enzyme
MEAAREGRVYISLDVFDKEPSSGDSITLSSYDKVTCTPHIGGHCLGRHGHMFGDVINDVERFIIGEKLLQEVRLEDYQRQSLY